MMTKRESIAPLSRRFSPLLFKLFAQSQHYETCYGQADKLDTRPVEYDYVLLVEDTQSKSKAI